MAMSISSVQCQCRADVHGSGLEGSDALRIAHLDTVQNMTASELCPKYFCFPSLAGGTPFSAP